MKLDLFGVGQELLLLQAIFTTALSLDFSCRLTSKARWNWREPAGRTRAAKLLKKSGFLPYSADTRWFQRSSFSLPKLHHMFAGSKPYSHIQIKILTRRSISIFCAIHSQNLSGLDASDPSTA